MFVNKIKQWNALLLVIGILFCCIGLSGCSEKSIEINTKVTLGENNSGVREMLLNINKEDFEKVFSVSVQDLNAVMDTACPEDMQWTYASDDTSYQYTFSISFTSVQEYQQKSENILGRTVQINLEQPGNAFTSGLKLQEDFTSLELLGWLQNLLVQQGYISQQQVQSSFAVGEYEVSYKEQTYTGSNAAINIDELVTTPVKQIDFLTSFQNGNQYSRKILFQFEPENIESNKDAIAAYLNEKLPGEAAAYWQENEDNIFVIELNYTSWNQQNDLMKSLMGTSDSYICVSDKKRKDIFSFTAQWDEYLDVSAFVMNGNQSLTVGYYIQSEEGIALSAGMSDHGKYALKDSNLYGGYQQVFQKELSKEEVICTARKVYIISDIEVSLAIKSKENIEQEILLYFAYNPEEDEQNSIIEKITDKTEDKAQVTSSNDKEDRFIIQINQSGKMKDVARDMRLIYGENNNISYEESGDFWAWKHTASFIEQIDLSNFIENDEALTNITYNLTFPWAETIQENSISSTVNLRKGSQEITEHHYSGTLAGTTLNLTLRTNKINLVLVWIIGISVIIFAIIFCILIGIGVFKRMFIKVTGHISKFHESFLTEREDDEDYTEEKDVRLSEIWKEFIKRPTKNQSSKKEKEELDKSDDE